MRRAFTYTDSQTAASGSGTGTRRATASPRTSLRASFAGIVRRALTSRTGEIAENHAKQFALHHRFRSDGVTYSVPVPVRCELEPAPVGSMPRNESDLKIFREIPAALRPGRDKYCRI